MIDSSQSLAGLQMINLYIKEFWVLSHKSYVAGYGGGNIERAWWLSKKSDHVIDFERSID